MMRSVEILLVVALAGVLAWSDALVVGWNDEFNTDRNWTAFQPPNAPDISAPQRGVVRLRIGKNGMERSIPFFWTSAWRIADVDVGRYPILAVNARNLRGPGWWDVVVQRWEKGRPAGPEIKTPSLFRRLKPAARSSEFA